jgi:hypothetical protein
MDGNDFPTWATVTLAIGGLLLAALGSLVGFLAARYAAKVSSEATRFSAEQEELRVWRTRLVDAAEEFSAEASRIFVPLAEAAVFFQRQHPEAHEKFDSVFDQFQTLARKGQRARILFGPGSAPGEAAEQILDSMLAIMEAFQLEPAKMEAAVDTQGDLLSEKIDAFIEAAHQAVTPPSVRNHQP